MTLKPFPANAQLAALERELPAVVHAAQKSFCMTNWFITALVTVASGILAYFISGRALQPLRRFASE